METAATRSISIQIRTNSRPLRRRVAPFSSFARGVFPRRVLCPSFLGNKKELASRVARPPEISTEEHLLLRRPGLQAAAPPCQVPNRRPRRSGDPLLSNPTLRRSARPRRWRSRSSGRCSRFVAAHLLFYPSMRVLQFAALRPSLGSASTTCHHSLMWFIYL